MKKLEIFDPPMCCSTGVCGPSVDPVLVQVSEALNMLKKNYADQVEVERHMMGKAVEPFQKHQQVMDAVKDKGLKALPLTTVDGNIIKSGSYALYEEIIEALGLEQ